MAYMKTAISIDERLFRRAERLSAKLQVSRSQLFAQALEYLLDKSESLEIIRKLNEVYGQDDSPAKAPDRSAKKRMRRLLDEW